MRSRLALVALAACVPPVPDDTEFPEPAVWLLAHLATADEEDVAAHAAALGAYAAGLVGLPGEEDDVPVPDRTFVPTLPSDRLREEAGLPGPAPAASIGVAWRGEAEVEDVRRLAEQPARGCLTGDATPWTREVVDGAGCFASGVCESASTLDDRGPTPWTMDLRAIVLDDEREALLAAGSRTDGIAGHGLDLWIADADDLRRHVAVAVRWVEGEPLGLADALDAELKATDAVADGGACASAP